MIQIVVVRVGVCKISNPRKQRRRVFPCDFPFSFHFVDFLLNSVQNAFSDRCSVSVKYKSHKIKCAAVCLSVPSDIFKSEYLPVRFHFQAQFFVQELFDLPSCFVQYLFISTETYHVVGVPDHFLYVKFFFDKMI